MNLMKIMPKRRVKGSIALINRNTKLNNSLEYRLLRQLKKKMFKSRFWVNT
jgi:hypothetical protein